VEKMQEECIKMVKPKANYRDIHMHAHKVATLGLMELGLLHNGTFEELYAAGASVMFLPHGVRIPAPWIRTFTDLAVGPLYGP
jgi:Xaa-Pro dipeptidase